MKSFFVLFALIISFATLALAENEEGSAQGTIQLNKGAKAEVIISGLSGKETDHASITGQLGIPYQECYDLCLKQPNIPSYLCHAVCTDLIKGAKRAELIISGLSRKETDHASITGQGIIKNYQDCGFGCKTCYYACTITGGKGSEANCAKLCGGTPLKNEVDGDANEEYPKGVEEVIFKHDDASITGQGIIKNYQDCGFQCKACYYSCTIIGGKGSEANCAKACGGTPLKNEVDGDANEEYPKGVEEVIFKHEEVIIKRPRKQLQ